MRKERACVADTTFEFQPGRFGRTGPVPGLTVQELRPVALASVLARGGDEAAARAAVQQSLGLTLPATGRVAMHRELALLGVGPGQWFAASTPAAGDEDFEARLDRIFKGSAALFDQSGGRIVLELAGPRVRDVLAKGFAIDLHPAAFGPGQVASTLVSHLNVQLWQVSDEPRYRVFVVRTYFGSFWRWLAAAAAEYGGEVLAPGAYSPEGAASAA
jgi:sarcosine oxidase subunit gamma